MEKQGDRYFPGPAGTESPEEIFQRIERSELLANADIAIAALDAYDAAKEGVEQAQARLDETFRATSQDVAESLSETERIIIDQALRSI